MRTAAGLAVKRAGCRARWRRIAPIGGFTLTELMVAVTIGLIVLAAVSQIFATSRLSYKLEENLARVQENGRFGMEFLSRDLRMAGYAGCVNVNQALNASANYTATNGLNNAGNDPLYVFAPQTQIQGYEWTSSGTWSPALPGFLAGKVRDETDVILIRRASDQVFRVTGPITKSSAITIADANNIEKDDIILIGDCSGVDVVRVTDSSIASPVETLTHAAGGSNGDNNAADLSKDYDTNAEVMKLVTRVYYIGTGTSGEPALMSMDMEKGSWATPLELIDGIESMQILYGEDTDANGSADEYRLPANVTDWSRVVSIRVGLLSRTPTESGQDIDGKTYSLLSDAGTMDDYNSPSDKRQRRIFSSTIQVRNLRTD
jgi:type IV pilus assembly protein PilW